MHTKIYYFSGTGNSLAVAKELAEQLDVRQVTPMAQVWQQDRILAATERVGLVFPLYYTGLPQIVWEFAQKVDLAGAQYTFAVVTRGVAYMGGALHQLQEVLAAHGQKLQAGWYVNMPQNYIPWLNVPVAAKQRAILQKASQRIARIAAQIQQGASVYEREPLFWLRPFRNTPFLKTVHQRDCRFRVTEHCNACGVCQRVCPVGNIVLKSGSQPQWQHRCQECLACIHLCPQQAIQIGTHTLHKQRYCHPDVTIKDLSSQQAARQAAII
jgi:Fe-S-cluster-containing hydrogenase component 2